MNRDDDDDDDDDDTDMTIGLLLVDSKELILVSKRMQLDKTGEEV